MRGSSPAFSSTVGSLQQEETIKICTELLCYSNFTPVLLQAQSCRIRRSQREHSLQAHHPRSALCLSLFKSSTLLLSRLVTPAFASLSLRHTFASQCRTMSTHLFHPLPHGAENAEAISALFREGGPGTTVLLVPRATYVIHTSIDFVHARTTLATEGYPTFESGEQAIIETRGEKEAGAVNMFNKAEVALKRVHIRGCRGWGRTKPETKEEEEKMRKEGKLGWIEGGGALVWMGGPQSHDAIVEGCRLEDPRGWTAVSCLRDADLRVQS